MAAFLRCIRLGRFILGPELEAFENEAAAYLGVAHVVGCGSGTDSLVLALRALGIGPGDEVITTTYTFYSTAGAIALVGARPVFLDISLESFNLDLSALESAITPKTRAIMPVHLFGQPVDMEQVLDIARQHKLFVIEDASQAIGAEVHHKKVGGFGDMGCFSLYPTKNLGACGDGGIVATPHADLAAKLRLLRSYGESSDYQHEVVGTNSKLDEIQAAFLRLKLPGLEDGNRRRQHLAHLYHDLLSGCTAIRLPLARPDTRHVFHRYVARVLDGRRKALQAGLAGRGIQTQVYYDTPLHRQPVFGYLNYSAGSFPNADLASQQALALPLWPEMRDETVAEVSQAVLSAMSA
jgi:dTDP-4-amino-4,6-dideoxygalactose transaminase